MRVLVSNLGCKLNQAEVESYARAFHAAGYTLVHSLDEADLHVVNTCTVTHLAARDSRKMARRGARSGRPVRTVLTGCYATAAEAEASRLPGVELVVPNDQKDRLPEAVTAYLGADAPPPRGVTRPEVSFVPLQFGYRRAGLKVEDGCNMTCSFCIIPSTRGRQTSRSVGEVLEELNSLVAAGVREVVVTGVQISSYRSEGACLVDLVEALLARSEVERLRLTSIAPWQFDERLFGLLAHPRICRHVHLSLQSGCDETLVRMRRPYSAAAFAALVDRLRAAIPGIAVTTDVIVGFPGETDEEFETSLELVREIGFSKTHVFTYSSREGTRAEALPDHVEHAVKKARTARLLEVARDAEDAFLRSQVGERADVLWEETRDGALRGTTDNYVRVALDDPAAGVVEGSIGSVQLAWPGAASRLPRGVLAGLRLDGSASRREPELVRLR